MLPRSNFLLILGLLAFLASTTFAQSKSAVQFYDTLGATKTGKVGWTGDATSGHIFIQTPNEGEVLRTQSGGVAVTGTVTATKFAGDGSTLTNLPAPATPTVGGITGLQDSLNKKANNSDVISLQGLVGAKADSTSVNTKLIAKANAGDLTSLQTTVLTKVDSTWVAKKISASGAGSISDGSVTTTKIADKAVTDAKIDSVSFSKLKGVPSFALATSTSFDSLHLKTLIATGNVGIGTTSPGSLLDVAGTFKVDNSGHINSYINTTNGVLSINRSTGGSLLTLTNPTTSAYTGASGYFTSPTGAGGSTVYIENTGAGSGLVVNSGNVGIGTSSPTRLLTIQGSGTNNGIQVLSALGNQTLYGGASASSGPGAEQGYLMLKDAGTSQIVINAAGNSYFNGGNVGIGITAPGALLQVGGGGTAGQQIWANAANTILGATTFDSGNNDFIFGASSTNTNLELYAGDSVRMHLNGANGNVGVGTTSPGAILEVHSNNSSTELIRGTAGTNNQQIQIGVVGWDAYVSLKNGAGTATTYLNSNGPSYFTGGNVGIGATDPGTYKLNVAGTTFCTGGVWAGSDRRYKTDVTPIDSSLSKVSKLQGVYYNWDRAKWPKKNFPEGKQVGLIAQEVEKVIPEVVNTDKEGYKSLSYDKLTAVLIEAMKEQQKEIDSQKEMIVLLKKEVEGLKAGVKK